MPGVILCPACERWVNSTHAAGHARSVRLAAARLVCRAWPEHRTRVNRHNRTRRDCVCNAERTCLHHAVQP